MFNINDYLKSTNTTRNNKYIKEKLEFNVKEDKEGRLYAQLKLPMVRSNESVIDVVEVEFYLDQLEVRADSLVCCSLDDSKLKIDNGDREIIFKAKEIKDGVYAKMTTHKIMTMEDIEEELGYKVILKDDDKFNVGELMKYYENLLK